MRSVCAVAQVLAAALLIATCVDATRRSPGILLSSLDPNTPNPNVLFEPAEGQMNCAVNGMQPARVRSCFSIYFYFASSSRLSLQYRLQPHPLNLCHKFNDKSCCTPLTDNENLANLQAAFGANALVLLFASTYVIAHTYTYSHTHIHIHADLGVSCRIRDELREEPIAMYYCLNCDPNQPRVRTY